MIRTPYLTLSGLAALTLSTLSTVGQQPPTPVASGASSAGAAAAASAVRPLFDGKSLAGFTCTDGSAPVGWEVLADGVLHFTGKGKEMVTTEEFESFELEWEWKLNTAGNNGIKYWVTKVGGKEWLGVEYQMIDDANHPDGKRGGSHTTGSIYDIYEPVADKVLKSIGEWNQSKIVVRAGKIEHWLNGKLTASADSTTQDWKDHIAKSKFKAKEGFAPGKGKLMLTAHGDPAWFRNLKIKAL